MDRDADIFVSAQPSAEPSGRGPLKEGNAGWKIMPTPIVHSRRGLSALELVLLTFSVAMIVAITLTL